MEIVRFEKICLLEFKTCFFLKKLIFIIKAYKYINVVVNKTQLFFSIKQIESRTFYHKMDLEQRGK